MRLFGIRLISFTTYLLQKELDKFPVMPLWYLMSICLLFGSLLILMLVAIGVDNSLAFFYSKFLYELLDIHCLMDMSHFHGLCDLKS